MRRAWLGFWVVSSLVSSGCGGDSADQYVVGDFKIALTPGSAKLSISDATGRELLPDVANAFGFRSAATAYEHQFGAFRIIETPAGPWTYARRATAVTGDATALRFTLEGEAGALAGVEITSPAEGELVLTITASATTNNRLSYAFGCAEQEHFLGFGGQTFESDHRTQVVPLWVSEGGIRKEDSDEPEEGIWFVNGRRHSSHTPIPIFLSSRGYAGMLDTPYRSIFAMCSPDLGTDPRGDAVRVEAWEPRLAFHLFNGPTPKQALFRMTRRVGRPALPPPFTFAPWLDAMFGSANVRRVAAKLRAEDIPSSAIWSEDWRGGNHKDNEYILEEDWEVDRALYPDFEAVAGDLHAGGFRFLTYNNTFLSISGAVHAEAVALGHTIKNAQGQPYYFTGVKFEDSTLADLSSPAARAFVKQKMKDGLLLGADGWMADFGEWLPTDAVLASGESAEKRHNLYPNDYIALNKELLDEQRAVDGEDRVFFVRAAYNGAQPNVQVVWAGDQQTDFDKADGYPSIIPMGIGLGVTGFPYYGHDIGGYTMLLSQATTRELWFRWVTLGALSPVMRTHHGRNVSGNWNWEKDAESIAHFRRWAKLHTQLYPYLYAMAKESADKGVPMFRALALDHPSFEPGWTSTDQYMLGDRIVVAPVIIEGATSRRVELPPGRFYPLLGGPAVMGAFDAPAPVDALPAFVPAGTLLALLPDTIDTLARKSAPEVVGLDDVGDDRELWLWPGGSSQLTETSGLSYTWSAGTLAAAPASVMWNGAPVAVTAGVVTLTGSGTLTTDGGANLVVTGGAVDRTLVVRFR